MNGIPPDTRRFLEEISRTVRAILGRRFPGLTLFEREDVEGEVFLKICKMTSRGKKIEHWESYLWKVVYTTALDLLEKRWVQLPSENFPAGKDAGRAAAEFAAESNIDRAMLRRDLEHRLEGISRLRRVVLKLRLAGMDVEEMAAHLDWTPSKVRHLYYRGLADLRRKFHRLQADRDSAGEGGDNERSDNALSGPGRIRKILPE